MKKDNWILKAFLYTFFIALFFNAFSNIITNRFDNLIILTILALLFIFIGIIFDIIGTAVLIADESTFHAKSSKKIKGAKKGVYLIKNGSRISSIFNDVIGDICGIISGACGTNITLIMVNTFNFALLLTGLIVAAVIASLTIGGKAIGKGFAINNSNIILYEFVRVISIFHKS
jgi:ABC-type protease/lipase transport system fused ATPase/permease subunit